MYQFNTSYKWAKVNFFHKRNFPIVKCRFWQTKIIINFKRLVKLRVFRYLYVLIINVNNKTVLRKGILNSVDFKLSSANNICNLQHTTCK